MCVGIITKLLLLCCCIYNISGEEGPQQDGFLPYVTLFEHYFYGKSFEIDVSGRCKCHNLPYAALNMITSIHTNGNCVIVFKDKGCYGAAARMEDYTYGYRDLGLVQLNDQISALQRCNCDPNGDEIPQTTARPIN